MAQRPSNASTHGSLSTTAEIILDNVLWIVRHLDAKGLEELDDLPVLELAKHISIKRVAA